MRNLKKWLNNHKGLSLVELLVTISIMAIITAGLGAAVVSAARNYSKGTAEVDMQTNAQNVTNILTNIIIDSIAADNSMASAPAEGEEAPEASPASLSDLYIKTVDNSYCYMGLIGAGEDTPGEIYYGEGVTPEAAFASKKVLAENVLMFAADTSTYADDYTVHITMDMYYKGGDRKFQSSFSVTSRNAEAGGSYIDSIDGAAIVCDTSIVIEPNQELVLSYKLLTSGSVTKNGGILAPVTMYSVKEQNVVAADIVPNDKISVTKGGYDTNTGVGTINVKASATIPAGTLYIQLKTYAGDGTNSYDTKWISVFVRRVTDIDADGEVTSGTGIDAGSQHRMFASLGASNPGRYYALSTDDDYVSPNTVVWKVDFSNYSSSNITVKNRDGNSVLSQMMSPQGYITTIDDTFTIVVNVGLKMGNSIDFTVTSLHAAGKDGFLANRNKTGLPYGTISDTYSISCALFSSVSDYQRGTNIINDEGVSGTTNGLNYIYGDRYNTLRNTADELLTDEELVEKALFNEIEKKKNEGTLHFNYFYRIRSGVYDGSSSHWDDYSQYRIMSDESNYKFDEFMAKRCIPDRTQEVEMIAVLYDTASKKIYWPNYASLLDYGFGNSGTHNTGLNYSFHDSADKYTKKSFSSYGYIVPIAAMDLDYTANSGLGITKNQQYVGSTNDPLIATEVATNDKVIIVFDHIKWSGINYNKYTYCLAYAIQVNYMNGRGWEDLTKLTLSGQKEYHSVTGGFRTNMSNLQFEIWTSNINGFDANQINNDAVYRIIPYLENLSLAYIKESEGIFSKNLYMEDLTTPYNDGTAGDAHTAGKGKSYYMYSWLNTNMYADRVYGSITFKRNGKPVTATLELNSPSDSQAQFGDSTRSIVYQKGEGITLPANPTCPGYMFRGWYTSPINGDVLTTGSRTTVTKIYAQWVSFEEINSDCLRATSSNTSGGNYNGRSYSSSYTFNAMYKGYSVNSFTLKIDGSYRNIFSDNGAITDNGDGTITISLWNVPDQYNREKSLTIYVDGVATISK